MTVIHYSNMNPSMQHMHHHPPAHPGEGARGPIFNNRSGPENYDPLADQMGRLSFQDRAAPNGNRQMRGFSISEDVDEYTKPVYVGYKFTKAPAIPPKKALWKNAESKEMNLSQEEMAKLVQHRTKKEKYDKLTQIKRDHVEDLLEELREDRPMFNWSCVYAKEHTRNTNKNGYETVSMDIIILGKPNGRLDSKIHLVGDGIPLNTNNRVQAADRRMLNEDQRQFARDGQLNDQWRGHFPQQPQHQVPQMPPGHQPPQIHQAQQLPHMHPAQHLPQMHPAQQPPQMHPAQQPPQMHPAQQPPQIHQAQQPPQIHQNHHPPQMPQGPQSLPQGHQHGPHIPQPQYPPGQHRGGVQYPNKEPWVQGVPVTGPQPRSVPGMNHQMAPGPEYDHRRNIPVNPESHNPGQGSHYPQNHVQFKHPRAPSVLQEPDLEFENSSISSKDESLDADLETEASYYSDDSAERLPSRREPVYSHYPSSKTKRSPFKSHSRKASKIDARTSGYRDGNGVIDIYPGNSRRASKYSGKYYHKSRAVVRHRPEQPIIRRQDSIEELEERIQNDLRFRELNLELREAKLDEREKLLHHNTRVLNDQLFNGRSSRDGLLSSRGHHHRRHNGFH